RLGWLQIAAKTVFGAMMRSNIVSRSFKMRLVQFWARDGRRAVASLGDDGQGRVIQGVVTSYELAGRAIAEKLPLKALVDRLGFSESVDIRTALAEGRVLPPLDHPDDPAHLVVTGTGL